MPTYGVTPEGYFRKPFAAIRDNIIARTRRLVGANLALDDKDPFGAIIHASSEELDILHKGVEAAYYSNDPLNAEGFLLFALGGITGKSQLPPQKGSVYCNVDLDANKTFAAGELVAHVNGNPENRWVNQGEVVSVAAGVYTGVLFVSEHAGAQYVAPAFSLNVLAERKAGWKSISNPEDANPGKDAESVDDFRVRREESLAIQGSASAAGVRSDVAAVTGVLQVRVYENDTGATADGLPPHSIRVVVWDDDPSQADDDEIAQAILDSKAGGIQAYGTTDSGTAVDPDGNPVTIPFDRATIVSLYCEATIVAPNGASVADINAALIAKVDERVGNGVVFLAARSAPLAVAGVVDVPSFKLDTLDPPINTSANLAAGANEILILDSGDISLSIVPS